MLLDASKPIVKGRAAAKHLKRRGFDGPRTAIDVETEHVAQLANPGAIGNLREYHFRIEARDEGFQADVMGHVSRGNAYCAVGPEVDARARQCGQADYGGDNDPLSQVHMLRD